MHSIAYQPDDVIVGVDTHKDLHVAYAIDGLGRHLDHLTIPATTDGYLRLGDWATNLGPVAAYGVEGTGSYGVGLARYLRRHDARVVEVNRPNRADRRQHGKDDTLDAEHAARSVLSGKATTVPKAADGAVEIIRVIKIARSTAVKAQTQAMIALKATLITAEDDLRATLEPLTDHKLVLACAELPSTATKSTTAAMHYTLGALANRWLALHEEIKDHTRQLKQLTADAAPDLLALFGIGFDTAAEMLITFGDNPERIRSEAAFAKMCGVCPIPASSGRTARHRLYRGGNRQANAALHRVVVVRMRWHEPTKAYVQRRTAEGKTKREIMRCLKRYLARQIYQTLTARLLTVQQLDPVKIAA